MPWYERGERQHYEVLAKAMKKYHADLADAEVRVQIVVAHASEDANGEPTGPAVRLHGMACLAVVRILGLKDRLLREHDAEITLDGDNWPHWSAAKRLSVMDHELTHLELQVHKDSGIVQRDDLDRPKLKMRPHDWQVGWFHEVAERHGVESVEVQQFRQLTATSEIRQLYLPFSDAELEAA